MAAQEAPEPSYVLVEIETGAEYVGLPAVCPGSSPDEDQSEVICLAELYEADARVLQHLGGPATEQALRVRFTAHSFHAVWRPGTRFLLKVLPFVDGEQSGMFAAWWDWEKDGEFCQAEDDLSRFPAAIQAFFADAATRITGENDENWSENIVLRCVSLDSPRN